MTQAVTRYTALFESIRSRRRRSELPRGLDVIAAAAALRLRNRKAVPSWLRSQANLVDSEAPAVRVLSEAALDEAVREVRELFVRNRQDDAAVRRALALVREVARRETGEEAFVVQLMGALALYHGRIIEMLTGEGKTLTGSLIVPLLAWRHKHVHIFTVNDYLARRDAASRTTTYARCLAAGRRAVGAIQQETDPAERFILYARPILYGTPKQITADWLRDQIRLGRHATAWAGRQGMALTAGDSSGPMIPGLQAALVDEADAVLIDEGVVPLIIARSRREDDSSEIYRRAAAIAASLDEGPDYTIDHLRRRAELRRRGRHRCAQAFAGLPEPVWRAARRAEELVRQALVARHCYLKGHQYQIVDGRVVIVDEYTGRFLPDRNWEHGLHQAVEAKENLSVTADRETLARMSFQRFFRSYPFLCGMTGTAADATSEMEHVYSRPVTVIPTNRPVVRRQWPTRFFRTAEARWNAVVASIEEVHRAGRPILVGTRSIEASESLSRRLEARHLPHRVLNANFDKEEADLIAQAGRGGGASPPGEPSGGVPTSITVATNMAGRGTDIKPDAGALGAGGLHVILTEMHSAKRIDRQFIGRAGRQGDPGSAQAFVSFEDELIRLHTPRLAEWLRRSSSASKEDRGVAPEGAGAGDELATAFQPPREPPPGHDELHAGPLLRRLFRLAQRRAEARARRSRAGVLRQDDWIDKYLPGS